MFSWLFSLDPLEFASPAGTRPFPRTCHISSVAQSCLTLCDPMDCSTPGLPVHHQLPELAQTHVHRVRDAIQPSHSLLSPSPPTFNLSQHQGLSMSHTGSKKKKKSPNSLFIFYLELKILISRDENSYKCSFPFILLIWKSADFCICQGV